MKYVIEDTTLTGIADSIRSKTGTTKGIKVADMASAIDSIEGEANYNILEDIEIPLDLAEGDQTVSAPEGSLVKSAIIKKPETLVPENIVKDIEIAGVIGTSVGGGNGGGSAEGFATVTFMNGNTPFYSRPVYIGDDCPDPVTQGRIEAPTKESTAQYEYTHNGWSSTNGGAADSNALKNITEDKVVYAAYSSSVRKYTITYYDEDGTTVLHTEQVAYGTVPSYVPTKEGYVFDEWTPEPTAVTSETSYIASWKTLAGSGACGDTAFWELTPYGVLTIYGEGEIYKSSWKDAASSAGINITDLIIEEGITRISDECFYNNSYIVNVTIPTTINYIGNQAFAYCSQIKNVYISDLEAWCNIERPYSNNSAIFRNGAGSLYLNGEKITNLIIPDGVLADNLTYAFYNCTSITNVVIPNTVTGTLGRGAFYGCVNIESIQIDGINAIGKNAFQGCSKLSNVIILDTVISIAEYAFGACSNLTSIAIPNSVTNIGAWVFSQCLNLTTVTIPNSVTNIGDYAFNACRSLTNITIPASVASIGSYTFRYADALMSVIFDDTNGWTAGDTALASENLADPAIAATYLISTYMSSTWIKA